MDERAKGHGLPTNLYRTSLYFHPISCYTSDLALRDVSADDIRCVDFIFQVHYLYHSLLLSKSMRKDLFSKKKLNL